MKIIRWVPGAVVSPNPITIPDAAPDIQAVLSAEITRLPVALCDLIAHPDVDIIATIDDHDVHAHDLQSTGQAPGAPAETLGMPVGLNALHDSGAAVVHTIPGGVAGGSIQNASIPAHVATAVPVTHGAGADPVVAAVPTRLTTRTISLNVDTLVGDVLSLDYIEVGERVLVS